MRELRSRRHLALLGALVLCGTLTAVGVTQMAQAGSGSAIAAKKCKKKHHHKRKCKKTVPTGPGTTSPTTTTPTTPTTPPSPHTLTVATEGQGSVTSSPDGIDCGSDCSEVYGPGQVVTLTPNADLNNLFDHWSGDCSGTGPCEVTLDADRSVTAVFAQITHSLAVSVTGDEGTVTDNHGGIDCSQSGGDCFEVYPVGTSVTLTEHATLDWPFGMWGGDCSVAGSASTCTLSMDADRSASATFFVT
jgi:hypothetical protein